MIEREPDGWKFAFLCNYQGSFEHIRSALLRVDQDALVVWKNPQAEQELRAGCGIVLRAGRLRATDRLVDQRLHAAIRWAGEVDDGVWPRRGTLPIVLGGGGGEPTQICWVIAQDSQILVSINDQRLIEDRLAAAAPVYGITAAQLRLASLIVAGVDLVEAAERLQVSVNTTRTHLQRMFDKTGVRSQPALVRALLSVALPLR